MDPDYINYLCTPFDETMSFRIDGIKTEEGSKWLPRGFNPGMVMMERFDGGRMLRVEEFKEGVVRIYFYKLNSHGQFKEVR